MPWLANLSLKVHPVLLVTPGRQGQSGAGVGSELVVHGNERLCGKWQGTYSFCSSCSMLIKKELFVPQDDLGTHNHTQKCKKKATETCKKWLQKL